VDDGIHVGFELLDRSRSGQHEDRDGRALRGAQAPDEVAAAHRAREPEVEDDGGRLRATADLEPRRVCP
jgi:hypothetical protein